MTDRLHAEQGRGDPFAGAVRATRMPMVISDPRQSDNPLVFVNDAFLELTGYERDEVLGRNCRFLQGPDTDASEVAKIRAAIAERTDVKVEMLNYRKDGMTFWNALYISPVFGDGGELQFFFASQFDVTERKERELRAVEDKDYFENAVRARTSELEARGHELQAALEQQTMLLHEVDHRVKNNLQMISAMIRNEARSSPDQAVKATLKATNMRIETLGTVHRRLYESKDIARFDLSGFLRETTTDLVEAAGLERVKTIFDLSPVYVPAQIASPLALLVHELITNALKHAFPDAELPGRLTIRMFAQDATAHIVIEDDGIGMPSTRGDKQTFGHRLVESLVRQMRGSLDFSGAQPGTRATVSFPIQADQMTRQKSSATA